MGSSSSAEVRHSDRPCALIQLRSWKGDTMETLVLVPLTDKVLSPSNPLFNLLHAARNEPAVRHWYPRPEGADQSTDRGLELEPEVSFAELSDEIFGQNGETSDCGVPSGRWMMLSIPAELTPPSVASASGDYYLSLDQVCRLVESTPSTTAAGYLESSHGAQCTTLRYWMVKSFSTEGRSLVLFQAAAFMEARKMQMANLRPVNPTAIELSLRRGDLSTLRTLEWSFRRLLPATHSACHQYVTVQPSDSASLRVRLDLGALGEVLSRLETQVFLQPTQGSYCPLPSLVVDQRPVERIVTPFAPLLLAAKSIWRKENSTVVLVQPNQRRYQTLPMSPIPSASTSHSVSSTDHSRSSSSGKTSSGSERNSSQRTDSTTQPPAYKPLFYRLPENTPVHFLQPGSGSWVPLWYSDRGARLQIAEKQPHRADGKVLLETEDPLVLIDERNAYIQVGGATLENQEEFLTHAESRPVAKSEIVVTAGCYGTQCTYTNGPVMPVQLFA